MFASLIAKAKANSDRLKTSDRQFPTLLKHHGNVTAEHALVLQRTVGSQAVLQLRAQQSGRSEQEAGPARREPRPGSSWVFSKIPLLPPDRAGALTGALKGSSPLESPVLGIIQRKLVVGETNDPLESEADRAAEHVMRVPDPANMSVASGDMLQRKCNACEQEEKEKPPKLARAESHDASAFDGAKAPPIVQEVLRSPGRALESSTRAFFEPRFGHDFSAVRVHADARAASSALQIQARAYTVGSQIAFGPGQYSANREDGRLLIAHELAHVVQQGAASGPASAGQLPLRPNGAAYSVQRAEADPSGSPGAETPVRQTASPPASAQSAKPQSGGSNAVKVFPLRNTRLGAAPIQAWRDGEVIRVHQPVYVLGNDDFRSQTKTLPVDTFTETGVALRPDEIVHVHLYELPHWYSTNITGSTDGDVETEFEATGEQMLKIADASTTATLLNIGLTVVDAASLFLPAGKVVGAAVRPLRTGLAAAVVGTADVAPTAFAGTASHAAVTFVDEQATQIAGRAASQTVTNAAVQGSEAAASTAVTSIVPKAIPAAATGAADVAGRGALATAADTAGSALVKAATPRPAGQTVKPTDPADPGYAPGLTRAQAAAAKEAIANMNANTGTLGRIWDSVINPGEKAQLTLSNSRRLFNNQRRRFWNAVFDNPDAKAMFEKIGATFKKRGNAPILRLDTGEELQMTIDHITERQADPTRALDSANLRISPRRENTVLLRQIHDLDPFQNPQAQNGSGAISQQTKATIDPAEDESGL